MSNKTFNYTKKPVKSVQRIKVGKQGHKIFALNLWKTTLSKIADRRVKSEERTAKSQERRAKSQEPRAKSQKRRAKSQEPRAKSKEARAKSEERRARLWFQSNCSYFKIWGCWKYRSHSKSELIIIPKPTIIVVINYISTWGNKYSTPDNGGTLKWRSDYRKYSPLF